MRRPDRPAKMCRWAGMRIWMAATIAAGIAASGDASVVGLETGSEVVPASPGLRLRTGDREISPAPGAALKIEQIQGGRLLVELPDGRSRGWVDADQVIPVDRALEHFDRAITENSRDAWLYASRASLRVRRHDYAEAIDDYDLAITIDPKEPAYYLGRGALSARRGDHGRTIADLSEAIRLAPHRIEGYLLRAMEWEKDLKPDQALADYQAAIAVDSQATAAYVGRGRVWKMTRDFGRLLENYEELARNVPEDPVGHREVAWLLATCDLEGFREGRRALAEATIACKLTRWSDPSCLEAIAAACAEVGDFESAVRWQSRAMQLFQTGLDRIDRRLAANKGRDARMSNGLYRYRQHLPLRERPDRTTRVVEFPAAASPRG